MCGNCVTKIIKNNKNCPFCRGSIDMKKMIVSTKEELKNKKQKKKNHKTKSEYIIDIINKKPTGKFIIFSEFFCKHFRIKNDHPLIFIVVLENDSNLVEFAKACNRLTKFAAVQVRSRKAILDNLGVEVTNERYILAPELMIERKSNLVILDIDLKIDFAVTELFVNSENCVSLPMCWSGVPWGRYAAGLTYFPYSNFSIYFLNLMKEYFSFALKHGPQWTLDQATFAVVVEYVRSKHINFQLHDIGIELYLKATRTTPMRLRGAKNRAKGSNLASMSEF
jgi:hypothetical protein